MDFVNTLKRINSAAMYKELRNLYEDRKDAYPVERVISWEVRDRSRLKPHVFRERTKNAFHFICIPFPEQKSSLYMFTCEADAKVFDSLCKF